MLKNDYRVGIIGGMGPMAGVVLQKLIIENTPAEKDQDHLQVVCFTNPQIPDRTKVFEKKQEGEFIAAMAESIKLLEQADVDAIAIPCNTSHIYFKQFKSFTNIPLVNMVEATLEQLRSKGINRAGLLATDASVDSKIFEGSSVEIIIPENLDQRKLMNLIYQIKAGYYNDEKIAMELNSLIKKLKDKGVSVVILGCTELSLYFDHFDKLDIIDPLRVLAQNIIKLSEA